MVLNMDFRTDQTHPGGARTTVVVGIGNKFCVLLLFREVGVSTNG